ncbi:NADH dehydrogenase, alpha subcomplex, subunit 8 [Fomitopsis serialis]|uniref:NADH dehydrogenase, alpha subcomplex, subunit 8 n=1 Tax=Fomitopsis serialis TaxID=139415 RepID=UPI0020077BB9|nr:NADH dehydrogenase, alpha subcomplex, subunit 8 [Neoantrodia serialis]KAH9938071.1 NADH dehydrogenase, alpha subcomplex, subunit 8 [Neoantrodia serialis]
MSGRYHDPSESAHPYSDPTPLPGNVPKVQELGASSAPLKSAAFFLGAHCKDYNEDFMLCKAENRDPEHCLKEGRRVTRCAIDLISKMRDSCATEFEQHWNCLEKHNQEYYHCRKPERTLNQCMFEKFGLVKTIPGTEGKTPIHEVRNPVFTTIQK